MTDISTAGYPAFLVPVGHDLGPHRLGGPGADRYEFRIRVGSRVVCLDDLHFAIWLLAHDSQEWLPNRARVVDAVVGLGLEREPATAALAALLVDGLLVEIDPEAATGTGAGTASGTAAGPGPGSGAGTGSARDFAETHQLMPLMLGLGTDGGDPGLRVIGLLDIPVVQVSMAMYDLWMWAHLEPNLWAACVEAARGQVATAQQAVAENAAVQQAAARGASVGQAAREVTEQAAAFGPDEVLGEVLTAVHPLLASRAAYLDVRADPASEGTVAA